MPAKRVYSLAIRYLKDDLIETLEKTLSKYMASDIRTEIKWVITVPAIWNDASKQFMAEAAEEVLPFHECCIWDNQENNVFCCFFFNKFYEFILPSSDQFFRTLTPLSRIFN